MKRLGQPLLAQQPNIAEYLMQPPGKLIQKGSYPSAQRRPVVGQPVQQLRGLPTLV